MNDDIKITGRVQFFLQEEEGGQILDSWEVENTVQNALKYQVAKAIGDGTTNFGIDDLFTGNAGQGGAQDGKDGICLSDATTGYTMTTTKDSGGTGSENTIVFKGVYTATGAYTPTTFYLGRALAWTSAAVPFSSNLFAQVSDSVTMANGNVLTVYWTLTIG